MIEIGRLCVKISGRDARRKCIVVDIIDKNNVLIDGDVRRRKCNIAHLEPLDKVIKIKKNASHSDVAAEFKKLKFDVWSTKPRPKTEKPKKVRKKKEKPTEEKPEAKPKKEEKVKEKKAKTKK